MSYAEFLEKKKIEDVPTGLKEIPELNPMLFDFQKDIVRWALKRGRACIFADCGLGKTPMQLEWAKHVPGRKLIVAPLAVAQQTIREGKKFGIDNIEYMPDEEIITNEGITNYERLEKFNPENYSGIVLDESSILKSYTGKIRNDIIERFSKVPFRLACTATPAPNDFMELGNHAEFVGAMTRTEMLSMFFVHDGGETQKWRLKGHAEEEFWRWVASWAVMIRKPSDLGYDDGDFILPELEIEQITVHSKEPTDGFLFAMEAQTLQDRQKARKKTIDERVEKVAEIVNSDKEQHLIWCNLNDESAALKAAISGSVEVKGADKDQHKIDSAIAFQSGEIKRLISKPRMFGYGLNFQSCHNVDFVGLSDSYEEFYQAVRRCWRFGQKRKVKCRIFVSELEGAVVRNIQRKEKDAEKMAEEMVKHMHKINEENIKGIQTTKNNYKENHKSGDGWDFYLGDTVECHKKYLKDNSIDYSIFSPPFASLYTYSNSDRDMGNCRSRSEFYEHYRFLIKEQFRTLKPGRLLSFHCMNLPTSKTNDGYIGIIDFRGELIRMYQDEGFIYHSEAVIWKDPVIAMQRTKALGLLHKQVVKDSAMSRQGIPDYLVTMRKPGINKEPISGEFDHYEGTAEKVGTGRFSIDVWQKYADPTPDDIERTEKDFEFLQQHYQVWRDVNPSDTLQHRSARDEKDERHICPLQLSVIHRGIQMWSNPGDLICSPFGGIASEGYEAIKMNRRFIGFELKESYWNQGCKNLDMAVEETKKGLLF